MGRFLNCDIFAGGPRGFKAKRKREMDELEEQASDMEHDVTVADAL